MNKPMLFEYRAPVYAVWAREPEIVKSSSGTNIVYGGQMVALCYEDGAIEQVEWDTFRLGGHMQLTEASGGSASGLYLLQSGPLEIVSMDSSSVILRPVGGSQTVSASKAEFDAHYKQVIIGEGDNPQDFKAIAKRAIDLNLVLEMIFLSIKARHGWDLTRVIESNCLS